MRKVRQAFDLDALRECVQRKPDDFVVDGFTKVHIPNLGKGEPCVYYFKDNGSPVLGVAHLDSVQKEDWCEMLDCPHPLIFSPRMDDRLGVYVITRFLPALGIKPNVLLTLGEETGRSTGQFYFQDPAPNWMFQFDRRGTDVVMYQYDDKATRALLKPYGLRIGEGTFSDISSMDHLEVKGFNFGVGYHDEHGYYAHCVPSELFEQVAKFVRFYGDNFKRKLKHDDTVESFGSWIWLGNFNRVPRTYVTEGRAIQDRIHEAGDYSWEGKCQLCGAWDTLAEVEQVWVCENCALPFLQRGN